MAWINLNSILWQCHKIDNMHQAESILIGNLRANRGNCWRIVLNCRKMLAKYHIFYRMKGQNWGELIKQSFKMSKQRLVSWIHQSESSVNWITSLALSKSVRKLEKCSFVIRNSLILLSSDTRYLKLITTLLTNSKLNDSVSMSWMNSNVWYNSTSSFS